MYSQSVCNVLSGELLLSFNDSTHHLVKEIWMSDLCCGECQQNITNVLRLESTPQVLVCHLMKESGSTFFSFSKGPDNVGKLLRLDVP